MGDLGTIIDMCDTFGNINDCKTFMILCISTSNFNNEKVYNAMTCIGEDEEENKLNTHALKYFNQKGYYFWFIEKAQDGSSYVLKPIPSQLSNASTEQGYPYKDVIIVGCAAIWNAETLKKVLEKWTKYKKDILNHQYGQKITTRAPIDGVFLQ